MSLRIWLPLLGNLNNQGLSNISITNNGATVDSNGKIGSCYSFNGSSSYILGTQNFLTNDTEEWSYCCWMKVNSQHNGCLFSCRNSTNPNGITIFYYSTQWLIDDGNRWQFTPSITINKDIWYHICVVHKKGIGKYLYVNGVLDSSTTNTGTLTNVCTTNFSIGNSQQTATTVTTNWLNGYLNDVRFYDHALSAKEIKEISKGLVCHYALNNNSIVSNPNLFRVTSFSNEDLATTNFTGSSTVWTDYIRYYNGSANLHTFEDGIDTISLSAGGNIGIAFARLGSDIDLDTSSYYTISCEAKCTKANAHLDIGLSYYNTSNTWVWRGGTNPQNFNTVDEWQKFKLTFKPDADTQAIYYCFTVVGASGGTDLLYIKHCKLEKGSVATHWIPNVDDISYSVFGLDSTTEIDISGFKNNGTKKNTTLSNESPRYDISTSFNGTNSTIACGRGGMVKDEITVTGWYYSDNWSAIKRLASCTETGGWCYGWVSGSNMMAYMGTGTTSNTYKTITSSITLASISSGWHMVTMTYDGFDVKLYLDTELIGINNAYTSKTPIFYHVTNGIFIAAEASTNQTTPAGEYTACRVSDFRVYATALSEDDIKELYNIPITISDKGNILTQGEFSENSNSVEFDSTGVVDTNNITEFICNIFDENVYVEPDGSTWIRIFHHNNPAGGSFSSTDAFTSQVYIDENRWFNVSLCNLISDNWELMIKQKAESNTATESKFRWIQTANPMIATYDQTLSANVTKISTAGYTVSTFGGAYLKNSSNTYLACNNANASNWWGAIGSCVVYQGGIPAYNGVLVKTGYCDLYLRIDNANFDKFTIGKDFITAKEIIEI